MLIIESNKKFVMKHSVFPNKKDKITFGKKQSFFPNETTHTK
jgi:hypothetical protein